ncbi:hypothetical protein Flavo103_07700 [Flavobacterium collinsii]|nr:hypothetical protein Flavo103_07700 [Flavobacterium collinsii]
MSPIYKAHFFRLTLILPLNYFLLNPITQINFSLLRIVFYLLFVILNPNPSFRVPFGDWYLTSGI